MLTLSLLAMLGGLWVTLTAALMGLLSLEQARACSLAKAVIYIGRIGRVEKQLTEAHF